jgi:hypothetical protein
MALPSNWPARCGLGHSLAKHRIIILNPMSIAVQHAHGGRRFFAPAPPPRQNVACEGVGLIRLRFRGMLWRGLASWSDFVSGGTESSRTRRWRKPDSNLRSRVRSRCPHRCSLVRRMPASGSSEIPPFCEVAHMETVTYAISYRRIFFTFNFRSEDDCAKQPGIGR